MSLMAVIKFYFPYNFIVFYLRKPMNRIAGNGDELEKTKNDETKHKTSPQSLKNLFPLNVL